MGPDMVEWGGVLSAGGIYTLADWGILGTANHSTAAAIDSLTSATHAAPIGP